MTQSNRYQDQYFQTAVFDVDGTLLNSRHEVLSSTKNAIAKLLEQGVFVMVATGKTFESTRELRKELGITSLGVYTQGLFVCDDDGVPSKEIFLDNAIIRDVLDLVETHQIDLIAYAGSKLLTTKVNAATDRISVYHEPRPLLTQDLTAEPVNKFLLLAAQPILDDIRARLENSWSDRAKLLSSAVPGMLEIVPLNTSKGGTVARVLEGMGRPAETTVAFGDGENDIELLQWAGLGVAMENASQKVQAAADIVTLSNNEGGLAHMLNQLKFSR
ncbi:MAG: HAD family hydrolase [Chloroflexota bacterium]